MGRTEPVCWQADDGAAVTWPFLNTIRCRSFRVRVGAGATATQAQEDLARPLCGLTSNWELLLPPLAPGAGTLGGGRSASADPVMVSTSLPLSSQIFQVSGVEMGDDAGLGALPSLSHSNAAAAAAACCSSFPAAGDGSAVAATTMAAQLLLLVDTSKAPPGLRATGSAAGVGSTDKSLRMCSFQRAHSSLICARRSIRLSGCMRGTRRCPPSVERRRRTAKGMTQTFWMSTHEAFGMGSIAWPSRHRVLRRVLGLGVPSNAR
jgi:hypothetical protein